MRIYGMIGSQGHFISIRKRKDFSIVTAMRMTKNSKIKRKVIIELTDKETKQLERMLGVVYETL